MVSKSGYCCNVLIVDENESVCKSLEIIVQNLGHNACFALTGESAKHKIKNHILDIAFIDHDLPDMDGIVLIDEIKKKEENPDIFMILPERTIHNTRLKIREDITGFIKKPIVMEEILLIIETTAIKRKLLKENFYLRKQINDAMLQLEISSLAISHDAINDIQHLMGEIELISKAPQGMTKRTIEICLAVLNRLAILLNMFNNHDPDSILDFLEIIESLADSYMKIFSKMKIDIICDNQADCKLPFGSRMLIFVFNNLLSNIIKHTGTETLVEIKISQDQEGLTMIIKDNGPGIDDHIRDRLFKKGVSTKKGGVGLYLSKKVIEYLEGSIELLQTKRGAAFKISLPTKVRRKWTFI